MTSREREEYKALRATIRERSTARSWTFVAGLSAWSALVLAVLVFPSLPVAALPPLFVLAATFEVVFALHVAVERIGRYIQVFYEEDDDRGWERTAMAFGKPLAGTSADPLFTVLFGLAILFNFLAGASTEATGIELGVTGAAHAAMLVRLAFARQIVTRQRAADLDRFRQIKSTAAASLP